MQRILFFCHNIKSTVIQKKINVQKSIIIDILRPFPAFTKSMTLFTWVATSALRYRSSTCKFCSLCSKTCRWTSGLPSLTEKKQFPKLKIYVILKISSKRGVVTKLRINNRFCSTKSGSKTSRLVFNAKKQDLLLRILMNFFASDFLAKGLFFLGIANFFCSSTTTQSHVSLRAKRNQFIKLDLLNYELKFSLF